MVTASAVALAAFTAARSPGLRASLDAGRRAFLDPSLLDPRPPAPPPPEPAAACARFTDDARLVDLALEQEFERPTPEDLDDPEGGALATLTMPDLRVPVTRRTMRYVKYFARSDAGRAVFLQRYRRAARYRETIEYALREAGLPEDLLWLAAIESGFDARAVSPAGASGLWQFMPETGQLYGLEQSPWADERRNIARSTDAAVAHLRDLYERFGRWDLALAAYNAGYDRIVGAMDKVARERGPTRLDDRPIGFADLAAARALPQETTNYVPQIMAFALIAANRSRFGLDQPELGAPLDFGEIAVPEGTRLRTIARAAGVSAAVLRDYNPQLLRDRVPPTGGNYLVAIPSDRVQHALAAFPAYADQEVLAQSEESDDGPGDSAAVPISDGFTVDPDADDPLPRRPIPLGRNRLPEVALPGQKRVIASALGIDAGGGLLEARLPVLAFGSGVGWQQAFAEDPLGLLGGRFGGMGAKGQSAAIDKQLAFLNDPPKTIEALRSFMLPNGIEVRVRRDKGADRTAITVRIASVDEGAPDAAARPWLRRGAGGGASEVLHTITVGRGEVDAGIEIAAARARLALGDIASVELAEIRHRAGRARRKALEGAPHGAAWLALGDALFPSDHPLAGTVLGATDDASSLRELLVADLIQKERARARASITIVGDVDELRAQKLAAAFLGSVAMPSEVEIAPHPRQDRVIVEGAGPAPHALFGWIGPGEGEPGDASLRVAIEILENPRLGRLAGALVERGKVASAAHAGLELGARASVAAIEIACAPERDLAEVERRLDAELDRLGGEGPEANDVAVAKFLLRARLQKELASAAVAPAPGAGKAVPASLAEVHSASIRALRRAMRPAIGERVLKTLDEVNVASVRNVVRRVLARDHRVVVVTLPKGS